MKVIKIDEMFECPFLHRENYQLSDYTGGTDWICSILKSDCLNMDCPLKKEKSIKVKWIGE